MGISKLRPILAKDAHTGKERVFSIEGWKQRAYGQIFTKGKADKYRLFSIIVEVHPQANKKALSRAKIQYQGKMKSPSTTGNKDADKILADAVSDPVEETKTETAKPKKAKKAKEVTADE